MEEESTEWSPYITEQWLMNNTEPWPVDSSDHANHSLSTSIGHQLPILLNEPRPLVPPRRRPRAPSRLLSPVATSTVELMLDSLYLATANPKTLSAVNSPVISGSRPGSCIESALLSPQCLTRLSGQSLDQSVHNTLESPTHFDLGRQSPDHSDRLSLSSFELQSDTNRSENRSEGTNSNAVSEYGRTYHGYHAGAYLLPNDEEEQHRLDIQHVTLHLLLDQKLSYAPIQHPHCVLDVATGTGAWAIEFARAHPESQVVGTDLSMIQSKNRPRNVFFVREDAEADEWNHPVPFDYIHLRLFYTSFFNMDVIIKNIWDNLEPGGWVEFQDHTPEVMSFDGSAHGSALREFGDAILRGLVASGRDPTRMRQLGRRLREVGFYGTRDTFLQRYLDYDGWINVQESIIPYPLGDWPSDPRLKAVGKWAALNIEKGLAATIKILVAGGLTQQEADDLSNEVRMELRLGLVRGWLPFYVVYAQKPPWVRGKTKFNGPYAAEAARHWANEDLGSAA